jgi:EAL domain-containing protein (putative c-di-GMP-specific phosphodiesterase class I)/ActR/RegA family two-component response regulator
MFVAGACRHVSSSTYHLGELLLPGPSPAPTESVNKAADGSAARVVLVVDDDSVVRSLIVGVLQGSAFATVEAASGSAALEVLAGQPIGVVLVDQMMPGMTGIELTRAIRELPDHQVTPVLFVSGVDSSEIRIQALQAGATDFMTKPVEFDEMVARVEAQFRVTASWRSTITGLQRRAVIAQQHRSTLQRILSERSFGSVFQPIVDLRDDRVVGYEALTRFDDGEPVSQRLIDADEAGMRPRFELALLSAALSHAGELAAELWMSINLSPSVLVWHTEELVELLGSTPSTVVVELTENERIDDYAAVRSALARLGPNVELSIDDTGAGYASLRHVVDLQPHYLKLDRSWITGLQHDDARQVLVAGLVAFCDHTGTDLIAEGVETAEERAALEALGVCYAQGYLLGRPAPLPKPAWFS